MLCQNHLTGGLGNASGIPSSIRSCPCRKAPSIATAEFAVVRGSLGIRGNSRRILVIDIESFVRPKGRYRV